MSEQGEEAKSSESRASRSSAVRRTRRLRAVKRTASAPRPSKDKIIKDKIIESVEWRKSSLLKWSVAWAIFLLISSSLLGTYWQYRIRSAEFSGLTYWGVFFDAGFGREPVVYLVPVLSAIAAIAIFYRNRGLHRDAFAIRAAGRRLEESEKRIGEQDKIGLIQLWEVTQKRLDYYHGIATAQARQSFRNAQYAMVAGLFLIVLAAILASVAGNVTGAVIVASLGAVGASVSAYVSRTFVRTQETSAEHLRAYFAQPLEFSKYLAAERLLAMSSPKSNDAIIVSMVQAILAQPILSPTESPSAGTGNGSTSASVE